jgi:4-oxalocrotonate tautomerase
MPHVMIKMYPGTSEELKEKIAQEITKILITIADKSEGSVSIAITDVAKEVWMEEVYSKEIEPNLDKLYKKPGY